MPYKFNEPRRHKIPAAKYRVTNWPDYDAALVRRGALTVWFTDEAIAAWRAPATGRRGGQPIYSALAIETALTIRLVFHQPLRQTEGLLRSIADVLGCPRPTSSASVLSCDRCRRRGSDDGAPIPVGSVEMKPVSSPSRIPRIPEIKTRVTSEVPPDRLCAGGCDLVLGVTGRSLSPCRGSSPWGADGLRGPP